VEARSGGTVELSLVRDSMQQRTILGGEKELYGGTSPSGMVYPSEPSTVATPFLMVVHRHGAADRAFPWVVV